MSRNYLPPPRDLRQEQRQALILALKRFGYTHCGHIQDNVPQSVHSAELKPCYVYIDYEALVILHRKCTDCQGRDLRTHQADFLKEMIPVIGRLDAHAEFDACEDRVWDPRLRIRLG